MDSLIRSAQRRLFLGHFGHALSWSLFVAFLVSAVAIAVPAIVPIEINGSIVDATMWATAWVGGMIALAFLVAGSLAWRKCPSQQRVAMEIDRRCGLKERVSSAMSLGDDLSESPAGRALAKDAEARAASLNVAEAFSLQPKRVAWLPLAVLPILAAMIMVVEPRSQDTPTLAPETNVSEVRQVKSAAEELKKRIAQQKRTAAAKGLEEARELFESMEAKLDKISKDQQLGRKEALIKLNDIKDQLEERRERLGTPDQMRKLMSQMKGLGAGPADKIAKQIQDGKFGKAAEEINKLVQKLKDGKLTEKEKEQLAKQAKKLADQLKKAAEAHERKKQDLQRQIDQAKREGRSADAAKLQQQLNEMREQDSQMQQMQQMADAMQAASDAMSNGDPQAASDAMQELSDQLQQMQDEMSELQDLESAMDSLSQCKDSMNCKQCDGDGCQGCQGDGWSDMFSKGNGQGRGHGQGDRPEAEDETNGYETQVRGNVKRGKSVIAGIADGPNRKGVTREAIKSAIESGLQEESDPMEDQVLPRDEREQTRQYFDQLRQG